MIARVLFIVTFCLSLTSSSQNRFQDGEKYGLEFEGETIYEADYDEIIIKDYFIYGKKGRHLHILSEVKGNSEKAYKKFQFHLSSELLVVGITAENKLDILSEDGAHYYMQDGDFDRVAISDYHLDTPDRDILLVSKNSKFGFYNWVKKEVMVPANYDRLQLHDGCDESGRITYGGKGSHNYLWSEHEGLLFSFKSAIVDDIYSSTICDGYILKYGAKIGYIREKKNGKFFLIKPKYADLFFPTGSANTIKVEAFDRFGLYHNNRKILQCKYNSIEVLDGNYIFANASRYNETLNKESIIKINSEGKIIAD